MGQKPSELRALCIVQDEEISRAALAALSPKIEIIPETFARSMHEAIEIFSQEEAYDICAVSDLFPKSETDSLFRDLKKIPMERRSILIQICSVDVPENQSGKPYEEGFDVILSPTPTQKQVQFLQRVITERNHHREILERSVQVDDALKSMLTDLDTVARERGRGRLTRFAKVAQRLIVGNAEFDPEVLRKYIECLTEWSTKSEPFNSRKVKVPEKISKNDLFKIKDEKYVGASARVWQKLLNKYGVKGEKSEE